MWGSGLLPTRQQEEVHKDNDIPLTKLTRDQESADTADLCRDVAHPSLLRERKAIDCDWTGRSHRVLQRGTHPRVFIVDCVVESYRSPSGGPTTAQSFSSALWFAVHSGEIITWVRASAMMLWESF
eukprot:TRINITY_DN4080_c0_g4_i1.p1 TRINITY_DN4080_c0_g4~~TRINITY_DN4080_c0_g4_i1.p1  ORF type:complete len:126 (+),score=15.14 TRINITY_DN4080_c0_g4_i1:127-504(+)